MSARDPGPPGWLAAGGGILPEVVERAQRFQADLTQRDVVFDLLGLPCSHIPHLPLEQLREEVIREGGQVCRPRVGRRRRVLPRGRTTVAPERRAARPWGITAGATARGGTPCWSRNG
ncbi:MAG: hypothetical protein ABSD47_00360 [Candidatus Methylomirabilota bacterium]